MSGFNILALIAAFLVLLMMANMGSRILNDWRTPASRGEPVATIGGPAISGVTTRQVVAPGTGQPIAVMPVPANPTPLTGGNPPVAEPIGGGSVAPNNAPRADELPPAPQTY